MSSINNKSQTLAGANTTQQQTTQKMGVAMNQRPITNTSTKDGHDKSLTHSDDVVHEPGWTLENVLDRYKFVGTYPIPSNFVSGQVIQSFRVPGDLIVNNITTQAPFNSFKYWSGHVEINAQLAASPGVQGCLAMVYVPLTDDKFIQSNILTNFSAMSVNQCCYLFPNTNTASNMIIPFNTPYSMLDLTDSATNTTPRDNLGYLYFVVFNEFQLSANTTDDTHVSLFVNFHDSKFKVPRLNGTNGVIRTKAQSEDSSRMEPKASSSSLISVIEDAVLPEKVIGDGFKTISTLFSLDKPTVVDTSPPVKVRSTQYMNTCNGLEHIDKMSLYPQAVSLVSPKSFATSTDEMEFRYLFSKFSYLGTFRVGVDDKVGTVVGSFPMSPTPVTLKYKPGDKIAASTRIPLLQYLTIPFEFWNGTINYRMQVVSTMMQSCKLFVALNYGSFLPSTTTNLNELTSQYGQIIEINQGSNTFDINAEYIAQTPMLHVASSNKPSEADTMGYVNIAVLNKLISGYGSPSSVKVNIFIAGGENFNVNTISQARNFVPTTTTLTKSKVFATERLYEQQSSTDESDFEIVRQYKNKRIVRIVPQAATQPIMTPFSEVDRTAEPEATAPSSGSISRPTTAQPYIQSVRHLLRKYQMLPSIKRLTLSNPGGWIYHVRISDFMHRSNDPTFNTFQPNADFNQPSLGLFTHYQKLYRQFNGSLSFKIMCRSTQDFTVFYSPPIYNSETNNSKSPPDDLLALSLFNFDQYGPQGTYQSNAGIGVVPFMTRLPIVYTNGPSRTAEFNVPFTSRFHSLLSSQGPSGENILTNSELIDQGDLYICAHRPIPNENTQHEVGDQTDFDVFFCLGDDARFGNLFTVPQVTSRYPIEYIDKKLLDPFSPDDLQDVAISLNTLSQNP